MNAQKYGEACGLQHAKQIAHSAEQIFAQTSSAAGLFVEGLQDWRPRLSYLRLVVEVGTV